MFNSRTIALVLALAACQREKKQSFGETLEARSLGATYLEQNRLPQAESAFKRLIALAPNDADGRTKLAVVYLRMGRPKDAEEALEGAVKRAPEDVDARLLLATVRAMIGRRAEARTELERLTHGTTVDPRVWYALAELARSDPDTARGRRDEHAALEKLAARVPGNVPARLALARSLTGAGDADGALRELEALQQLPPALPGDAVPAFDSAVRALRAGKIAQAATALTELERFLELTIPFQSGLEELRGPQVAIAGLPELTPPALELVRERIGRDSAPPEVVFVDATMRFPTAGPPGAGGAALAVGDFDGDRSEEVLVSSGDSGRARLLRWKDGEWIDAAAAAGIAVTGATAAGSGDIDNDGHLDLFVADAPGTGHLYRNDGSGRFTDIAAAAGVANPGRTSRIIFTDLDHDGDLDLLLATDGGIRFQRNTGDGTFRDASQEVGLANYGADDVSAGDLDDDGLLDIAVISRGDAHVFRNTRERRFDEVAAGSGLTKSAGSAIAVADYDNDGYLDLFAGSALFRNGHDGRFTRDTRAARAVATLSSLTTRAALFFDYDNDGYLDLVVAGAPGAGSKGVRLFRNAGAGRFADRSDRLPANIPAMQVVAATDLDRDRDLDLLVAGSSGMRLLLNEGGNGNLSVQVALTGLTTGSGKNNVFGIGARIEARVGDLFQMRVVTDRVTMIGLGRHLKADVIRVEWPNGVPQTLYYPGRDEDVIENQVLKSSCGFLYAWNGSGFHFVTDVMWRSALGMPIGIGGSGSATFAPAAASREYLKLPRGSLVADRGRYRLQLTEELWETSYTDQVELVTVDHPDSVDVVVDERFVPPGPPATLALYHTRRVRPPVSAFDDRGTDLLPALREADDRYASDLNRDRYQGVVAPHELILDLGDDLGEGQVLLLLRGWVFPTDASINVALSQGRPGAVMWPILEVKDGSGAWRTAIPDLSIPSGKNKVIVADLTGEFPTRDHRVRIRTNLQIYWDQVSVATNAPRSPLTVTRLTPASADVHFRGFSRMYRKGGRYGPHWFDYQSVSAEPAWRPIDGLFTRYGDVNPLLQAADDRYIVMAPGDETSIEFLESAAPPLPAGWTRDFFLYSVGWIKDADLNTAHGGSVEPLPFHAMRRYPYAARERYPVDSAHRRYLSEYNTRAMDRGGSLRGLAP